MSPTDKFAADGATAREPGELPAGSGQVPCGAQLTAVVETRPATHLRESTDSAFDGDGAIIDNVRMFGIAATQAGSFR